MHVARPESEATMRESEDIALYPGHKQGGKSSLVSAHGLAYL